MHTWCTVESLSRAWLCARSVVPHVKSVVAHSIARPKRSVTVCCACLVEAHCAPYRDTVSVSRHKASRPWPHPVVTQGQRDFVVIGKPLSRPCSPNPSPKPCHDTKVLARHGAKCLYRARGCLLREDRPGHAPSLRAQSRHGTPCRDTGPKEPSCDRLSLSR